MPVSLKSKLSKLRYNGQITDDEYKELIKKVDGHDKVLIEKFKTDLIEKLEEHSTSGVTIPALITLDTVINIIKGMGAKQ